MTDTSAQDYSGWVGQPVIDPAGEKVGKVSEIYVDEQSGRPEWLAVNTGMFSSKSSFVPLQGAKAEDGKLVISFDKAKVKDAPRVEEDADGFLTPAEEEELYRYYGRDYAAPAPRSDVGRSEVGRNTPATDAAMTRSEEEVRIGTERREAGRVRLRKYVVTEQVTKTVPVSHEEIRIQREPITDADRSAAMTGASLSEEEHEVTLFEERPIVQKEVVAKERVRVNKQTVTGEETVKTEVRKERIEQEGVEIVEPDRPTR